MEWKIKFMNDLFENHHLLASLLISSLFGIIGAILLYAPVEALLAIDGKYIKRKYKKILRETGDIDEARAYATKAYRRMGKVYLALVATALFFIIRDSF